MILPVSVSRAAMFLLGVSSIALGQLVAQPVATLHNFSSTPGYFSGTNSDGAHPFHSLLLAGETLYGTCGYSGQVGGGNLFKVNTDGTGFSVVHDFLGYKSSDGLDPHCGLVLSGNTLFGTTMDGGLGFPVVFGTVFAVDTDGTAPRLLQAFDHVIGHTPEGGLVLSGNTLYGTTYDTIFSINTDGSGFTLLHSASGTDGLNPVGLVISGNAMYGAAYSGGTWTNGAIFAVLADGTAYTLLHSFTATSPGSPSSPSTNSDGSNPLTGLVLSGDTLYGTAEYGGVFGAGTAFSLKTDGSGFRVLHNFDGTNAAGPSDLVVVGTTIYGAASLGSTWSGILFSMNTDGSGFTVLCNINHGFGAGGLVVTNNTIYGTSYYGGTSDTGTIFKFPLLPQLTITASGPNTILAWPTNPTGFSLQSTASLTTSASWTTVSPGPVVVNGQNTVTNPISGAQQFFRLSQ